VNKANVAARLKEIKGDKEAKDEAAVLMNGWKLKRQGGRPQEALKDAEADLDAKAYAQYPKLTRPSQDAGGGRQMARRARCRHPRRDGPHQPAAHPAREGAGRTLRNPLPQLNDRVAELEAKVNRHLERMGLSRKPSRGR
jgi:type I restriction enzyme M protein